MYCVSDDVLFYVLPHLNLQQLYKTGIIIVTILPRGKQTFKIKTTCSSSIIWYIE